MSFIAFPGWLVTFADLDFGWMFLPFSFRLHPLFVSYVCGWVGALPFVRFSWRRLSFFLWYPSRFLGAAALGSLWTCVASFVDTWGLRLALAECFPPFWWFVALGFGFV